jgi:hypothetical protein
MKETRSVKEKVDLKRNLFEQRKKVRSLEASHPGSQRLKEAREKLDLIQKTLLSATSSPTSVPGNRVETKTKRIRVRKHRARVPKPTPETEPTPVTEPTPEPMETETPFNTDTVDSSLLFVGSEVEVPTRSTTPIPNTHLLYEDDFGVDVEHVFK